MDIEEKLQKLGVEPGSGSNVPHLHGARAASVRPLHALHVSIILYLRVLSLADILSGRFRTVILQTEQAATVTGQFTGAITRHFTLSSIWDDSISEPACSDAKQTRL